MSSQFQQVKNLDSQPILVKSEQDTKVEEIIHSISAYYHYDIEDQEQYQQIYNKNQRSTPLVFSCKFRNTYIFSYHQKICFNLWFTVCLIIVSASLEQIAFIFVYTVALHIRMARLLLSSTAIIFFIVLTFLDAGTLAQDEKQKLIFERNYCIICNCYKKQSTRHCAKCNRCIQKHTQHCNFLGKCIGKRNKIIYIINLVLAIINIVCYLAELGILGYQMLYSMGYL